MNVENQRQQSLIHIIEEYLSRLAVYGLTETDRVDILREHVAASQLAPDDFLDEVAKVRGLAA